VRHYQLLRVGWIQQWASLLSKYAIRPAQGTGRDRPEVLFHEISHASFLEQLLYGRLVTAFKERDSVRVRYP
jgi:hypothetical protein